MLQSHLTFSKLLNFKVTCPDHTKNLNIQILSWSSYDTPCSYVSRFFFSVCMFVLPIYISLILLSPKSTETQMRELTDIKVSAS